MVDFSVAKAAMPAIRVAAKRKVNMVIGTTGFSAADVEEIKQLVDTNEIGAVMASNFAHRCCSDDSPLQNRCQIF